MSESDPRRRPSLSRWLSEKVDELTSGLVFGKTLPGEPGVPQPAAPVARPEPEPASEPAPAPPVVVEATAPEPEPAPEPVIPEAEHRAVLARIKRELDDAQLMLMGKEAEFKNDLAKLQERNAELLDRVVRLTQHERELEAKILDAKFEGSGAKAEAKRLDGELRDLRRVLKTKEAEVGTLGARIGELETRSAGLSPEAEAERLGQLAALSAQAAALEAALVDARRERDEAAARLELARAAAAVVVAPDPVRGEAPAAPEAATEPELVPAEPEPAITPDPQSTPLPPPRPARRRVTGLASEPLLALAAGQTPAAAARLLTLRARRENAAAAWSEHLRQSGGAAVPAAVLAELFPAAPAAPAVASQGGPRSGGENRGGENRGGGRRPRRRSR